MSQIDPGLRAVRFMPRGAIGPRTARLLRKMRPRPTRPEAGVTARNVLVTGPDGAADVKLRLFTPDGVESPVPAMFWIHGGGHMVGNPEQDDRTNIAFARELGIVVAAVRYRLGAESPAPSSLDDAYAGLQGLVSHAREWNVDPTRIAIAGGSAGGGIAAALALVAHDRGQIHPAFQMLVYPMLDDRTVTRKDHDTSMVRVWSAKSNRIGWTTYLGREPGGAEVSSYAAPARREDLSGLPPAWIGVGELDLFRDEDVEFARRLREAGVPCELHIVPGAFHGFDALFPKADVSKAFWKEQAKVLRAALLK